MTFLPREWQKIFSSQQMIPETPVNVLQDMPDNELRDLVERLTAYAALKLHRLTVYGVRYKRDRMGPGGFDPDDFVDEAFEATLSGRRPWRPESYPTIERHLQSVIDSMVSNLINSADNRTTRSLPALDQDSNPGADLAELQAVDPAKCVADSELSIQFQDAAYAALKDDPDATAILEALSAGLKRHEAIEYVGLSPEVYDAARKRMDRMIKKKCNRFFREILQ